MNGILNLVTRKSLKRKKSEPNMGEIYDTPRYLAEMKEFRKLYKKVRPATPIRNICQLNKTLSRQNFKSRQRLQLNKIRGQNPWSRSTDLTTLISENIGAKLRISIPETLIKQKDTITFLYTGKNGYVNRIVGQNSVDLFFERVYGIFNKYGQKIRYACPMFLHKAPNEQPIMIDNINEAKHLWESWPHNYQKMQRFIIPRSQQASILQINYEKGKRLSLDIVTNKKKISEQPKSTYDYSSRPSSAFAKIERDVGKSMYVHDINDFPYAGNLLRQSFHALDCPIPPSISDRENQVRPSSAFSKKRHSTGSASAENFDFKSDAYLQFKQKWELFGQGYDKLNSHKTNQNMSMSGLFLTCYKEKSSSLKDLSSTGYAQLRASIPQHEEMYFVKPENSETVNFANVRRPLDDAEQMSRRFLGFLAKTTQKNNQGQLLKANLTLIQEKSGNWILISVNKFLTNTLGFAPLIMKKIKDQKRIQFKNTLSNRGFVPFVGGIMEKQKEKEQQQKRMEGLKHAGKRIDKGIGRLLKQNTSLKMLEDNSHSRNHEVNDNLKSAVKRAEGQMSLLDISDSLDRINTSSPVYLTHEDQRHSAIQFYKQEKIKQQDQVPFIRINEDASETPTEVEYKKLNRSSCNHRKTLENLSYSGSNDNFHTRKYNTIVYDDYDNTIQEMENVRRTIRQSKGIAEEKKTIDMAQILVKSAFTEILRESDSDDVLEEASPEFLNVPLGNSHGDSKTSSTISTNRHTAQDDLKDIINLKLSVL